MTQKICLVMWADNFWGLSWVQRQFDFLMALSFFGSTVGPTNTGIFLNLGPLIWHVNTLVLGTMCAFEAHQILTILGVNGRVLVFYIVILHISFFRLAVQFSEVYQKRVIQALAIFHYLIIFFSLKYPIASMRAMGIMNWTFCQVYRRHISRFLPGQASFLVDGIFDFFSLGWDQRLVRVVDRICATVVE